MLRPVRSISMICRLIYNGSGYSQGHNVDKAQMLKKLCSGALFGTTLLGVMLAKRKKEKENLENFQDCVMLPKDENYAKSFLFYKYQDFILPDFVIREKSQLKSFDVRPDDIFVVSFPKSGTTWIQEIVYLINTNLDFKSAKETSLDTRFPYLEFIYPGIKDISKMQSIRYIKSHLPYSLLPPEVHAKKPKIIYVMRNPKDVVVSYYHYVEMLTPTSYKGNFREFFDSFLDDKVMYGPVWKHNLEYWEHQNEENILIVMYEDLQKDVRSEIRRISRFLEKELSDSDVEEIAEHCSFEEMAKNPSVNYKYLEELGIQHKNSEPFMRKGIVGDWLNYFTPDMDRRFEEWQAANYKKTGLKFVYELGNT